MSKAKTLASVVSTGGPLDDGQITAADIEGLTLPSGGDIVGTSATQTLTNKTIAGADNTLSVRLANDVTGTLPVANGGTGAASLTANNVLLGNGTSALQVVAPGSSGNILTSNGTTWTSAAAPAGGFSNMTVFTSSGTWSVPSGITKCMVIVTGGGGSAYNTSATRESGGAAGGTAIKTYTLSGGSATVTVGAGAGASSPGGTSSFIYGGVTVSATGGNSSTGGSRSPTNGGSGSGGDINISGGSGAGADSNAGGSGGASYWGGGGGSGNTSGTAGAAYGSGAGGNGINGSSSYTNSGKAGIVVIYY